MKKLLFLMCCVFFACAAFPQNVVSIGPADTVSISELPLRRVALFSSGVGYFEHSGTVSGNANLRLTFEVSAVNDVLMSLVINDPGQSGSPVISYPSGDTLRRTLQSLGIDLSRNPGIAEIFSNQRGAEIEVFAPNAISGRILGVERRQTGMNMFGFVEDIFLLLHTGTENRIIALSDIASFSFLDPALNADLQRALDIIASNRIERNRHLSISLPGTGTRNVSLSYVIAAPVWKVSYRLDLGQRPPMFQGWAIIDNTSDTDWKDVELSLISGRPVSFIQELYPPYYHSRPTLPLAIVGSAQARTFAGGFGRERDMLAERSHEIGIVMEMEEVLMDMEAFSIASPPPAAIARQAEAVRSPAPNVAGVQVAAAGAAAGDHFSFTIRNPVTLNRRESAMIPLVSGTIEAVKTLVLSGNRALTRSVNPYLAVELTNTTGMKLPAGPITVFDGGIYAGDALIEFFGENDRRLIKYGEDLSVIATAAHGSGSRLISAVTVSGGVMTISRRQMHERIYTVRNTASEAKRLIIEHPITRNANLIEPRQYLERTDSLYRFLTNLPANGELIFKVQEESPISERIVLAQLRLDRFISFSTNQEIPANVRTALAQAAELRQRIDAVRQTQAELEARRTRLIAEQDRIRLNLNAVGTTSDLGREYMRRMTVLDTDIDGLNRELEQAIEQVRTAQREFDAYIAGLRL